MMNLINTYKVRTDIDISDLTHDMNTSIGSINTSINDILEYLSFITKILGVDLIDIHKFKSMSEEEIEIYIRDKKIDLIIQDEI